MPRWLSKVVEFASTRNTHAQRILLTSAEILLDLLERKVDQRMNGGVNICRIQELVLPGDLRDREAYSPGPGEEANYCMDII